MSSPNYSYCAEYCPGRVVNCLHYKGRFGGVCETYKSLLKARNSKGFVCRSKLEALVEAARKVV